MPPASRNDITKKAQYTTAPDLPRFEAIDEDGGTRHIWASTPEEAEQHARAQGWRLKVSNMRSDQ